MCGRILLESSACRTTATDLSVVVNQIFRYRRNCWLFGPSCVCCLLTWPSSGSSSCSLFMRLVWCVRMVWDIQNFCCYCCYHNLWIRFLSERVQAINTSHLWGWWCIGSGEFRCFAKSISDHGHVLNLVRCGLLLPAMKLRLRISVVQSPAMEAACMVSQSAVC